MAEKIELKPLIRKERVEDVDVITEITVEAFKTLPVSNLTEHFIIHALRRAGALALSLVAELDGRVVGHVAFSLVEIEDGSDGWYGLGPVSVLPELHRQGIGKALIIEGLRLLKNIGAQGCVLVGDPAYYSRFGFRNYPGLIHAGVPTEVFVALPFASKVPQGNVVFHDAFNAKS